MDFKKPFWYKVILSGSLNMEIIPYILSESGSLGFQEENGFIIAYFPHEFEIDKIKEKIYTEFKKFNLNDINIKIGTIIDDGWSTRWRDYFKPVLIESYFYIRPPWYPSLKEGFIEIIINPGGAFGTGTHPTTQMSLYFLKKHILKGSKVLDAGCGSGILTIAALKMGAGFVLSVDNDNMVKSNFLENMSLNGIKKGYELLIKDVTLLENYNFDIIISNVDTENNIKLLNVILSRGEKPKVLIFSGFLNKDKSRFIKILKEYSFVIKNYSELKGWCAIVI